MSTFSLLKKKRLGLWNYESHCPKVLNKKKILEVIKYFGLLDKKDIKSNIPYLFNSLYFNYLSKSPFDTLELNKKFQQAFYGPFSLETIERMCKDKLILNFNDNGLTANLQKFIYKIII